MCDKISVAVQMLTSCVQGIMGCCTDRAEGWWKTVAIALFSLDAWLSVLIRPTAAQGSILLRWPKVLTQTFQVSVMMPQTCHSCHMTWPFSGSCAKKKKKLVSQDEASKVLFCTPPKKICPALHQRANLLSCWFTFHKSKQTTSCEFIGNSNDCNSGVNLSTKAQTLPLRPMK